jgi:hypothetical protein
LCLFSPADDVTAERLHQFALQNAPPGRTHQAHRPAA